MRHKLAFALVLTVTGLAAARPTLAANSGRTVGATVSGTIFFQYPITQGPTETLRFFTSNLSAGSDTVIHVQNADDGYYGYVAGHDASSPEMSLRT